MEPVTYPQKLCPLRSFGPNLLGETPANRNKSHSPQPPIRKRLYSEDYNTILLDAETRREESRDKSKSLLIVPQMIDSFIERDPQDIPNEETQVFSEEVFGNNSKAGFFPDNEEQNEDVDRSAGEILTFERNLLPLQDETQFDDEGMGFIGDTSKEYDQKNHFNDIFDSERKEVSLLGKRGYLDRSGSTSNQFKVPFGFKGKNSKKLSSSKTNLRLQENSAYVFNPKQNQKKSIHPMRKEGNGMKFGTPKQTKLKINNNRNRNGHSKVNNKKKLSRKVIPPNSGSQKRDSVISNERRGSHFQG